MVVSGVVPVRPHREYGLTFSKTNRIAVALVVVSLFLERFERLDEASHSYPILPIPDLFFLSAVALLTGKVALDLLLGRLALRPFGTKDFALIAFVVTLGAISFVAAFIEPEAVTSGNQVLKTFSHLSVLLGAAVLLGRALSYELVAYALKVFFVSAVSVSALGILQAVDQNVVRFGLVDLLDLISRPGADRFARPCSIFSEPALLGYASLGGIVIGLSVIAENHRVASALGTSICAAGLLLAAAAGPLVVCVILAPYVVIFRHAFFRRDLLPAVAAVAVVAALVWFLTPVSDTVVYRAESVSTGRDPSAQLRTALNEGSVEVWKISPITGVGLGNSRRHLSNFVSLPFLPGTQYSFNTGNAYVNLLGETGPLGVGALMAVFIILWWPNRHAPRRLDHVTRVFIVMLAVAFLIINQVVMPPLWFWAGLRLALQANHHDDVRSGLLQSHRGPA